MNVEQFIYDSVKIDKKRFHNLEDEISEKRKEEFSAYQNSPSPE
jgi:hypothetical protein